MKLYEQLSSSIILGYTQGRIYKAIQNFFAQPTTNNASTSLEKKKKHLIPLHTTQVFSKNDDQIKKDTIKFFNT